MALFESYIHYLEEMRKTVDPTEHAPPDEIVMERLNKHWPISPDRATGNHFVSNPAFADLDAMIAFADEQLSRFCTDWRLRNAITAAFPHNVGYSPIVQIQPDDTPTEKIYNYGESREIIGLQVQRARLPATCQATFHFTPMNRNGIWVFGLAAAYAGPILPHAITRKRTELYGANSGNDPNYKADLEFWKKHAAAIVPPGWQRN